jgi:hypothetical protein
VANYSYEGRGYGARIGGSTLYLNEEFNGGELEYYEGPLIRPVTGLLVVHDGEAVHGVRSVSGGTRYTIGTFFIA